jgi:hypothetical protein
MRLSILVYAAFMVVGSSYATGFKFWPTAWLIACVGVWLYLFWEDLK